VILYDTRGRGRSDLATASTPVGIDKDVDDLHAIRTQLSLDRVSLIGWSYFGAVITLYAAAHPEVVDRLVQVAPLGPRREPHWDDWMAAYSSRAAQCAQQFESADSALSGHANTAGARQSIAVRAGLRALVRPQLGNLSVADAIVDAVGTNLPNEAPDALVQLQDRILKALGNWDFRATAALVTAPVLTVHGSADNVSLASCREWVAAFPDARLLRMMGVGHYPFHERPSEFFAMVAEFLVDRRWPLAAVAPAA
jgi:pimeloyl-ACP methyl ester carboxylesterase